MSERRTKLFGRLIADTAGKTPILVGFDILCLIATSAAYILIESVLSSAAGEGLASSLGFACLQIVCVMVTRYVLGIYRFVWRYSSVGSYIYLVMSDAFGSIIALMIAAVAGGRHIFWQFVIIGAVDLVAALTSRFIYSSFYKRFDSLSRTKERKPVAIIGAGRIGAYIADDLVNNPNSEYDPKFFIDTDPVKIGNNIGGIRIYDPETGARLIAEDGIRTVIVTMSSSSDDSSLMMKIVTHYSELGCKIKMCDTLVRNDEGLTAGRIREFKIEDILFRKPVDFANMERRDYFGSKTVLITGGGGSIGSELCRQVASCSPRRLIIFDIYENNAYEIQQELKSKYGEKLSLSVEIGSVRDIYRLDQVFCKYRPDVVFHAAAHKHVPLMESCGAEAIKNNVIGTYNAAEVAEKYGVKKFILISTDKAVNPTNIMGASKRMCEMIVQSRADSRTSFAAVRFGNVLGSNGSVVPLFKRQIEEGGPVTITDKRIIRYFMTIPEASQLVLQAGAMAKSGELFVLDMGKPVKIYDLAVSMIRLSGYVPNEDIEIREIGLRPGEKLYEELLMKSENLDKTENDLIFIERDTRYTRKEIAEKMDILIRAANSGYDIKAALKNVVPTYHDPEEVNGQAEQSDEMKMAYNIA